MPSRSGLTFFKFLEESSRPFSPLTLSILTVLDLLVGNSVAVTAAGKKVSENYGDVVCAAARQRQID